MVDTNKTYMLVAAIDFGTAYSGYAFSTKSDFERDPLKVMIKQVFSSCSIQDKLYKSHSVKILSGVCCYKMFKIELPCLNMVSGLRVYQFLKDLQYDQ